MFLYGYDHIHPIRVRSEPSECLWGRSGGKSYCRRPIFLSEFGRYLTQRCRIKHVCLMRIRSFFTDIYHKSLIFFKNVSTAIMNTVNNEKRIEIQNYSKAVKKSSRNRFGNRWDVCERTFFIFSRNPTATIEFGDKTSVDTHKIIHSAHVVARKPLIIHVIRLYNTFLTRTSSYTTGIPKTR